MSNYDTKTSDSRMITGLFRDRDSAERAYASLAQRGYTRDDVTLMMSDDTRNTHFNDTETELGSKAAEGAGVGAGIGGTVGAVLAGVAAVGTTLVLPGIGLVVAGPLAAALAGAGAGGIAGGLVGALIGAGIPEERVKHYEEGIKEGGILMGVKPRSDADVAYIERSMTENEGQHVVGTGLGAGAGALAGAGFGAPAGPIGMATGAVVGGVAGGLAGKGAAEMINPKPGDELHEHHFAKGVGGGGGAALGAAVGAAGGPLGMAAGAAVGGLAGGMAGKAAGSAVNPEEEANYWSESYQSAPYYAAGYTFADYGPAYELGYTGRSRFAGDFDHAEPMLQKEWEDNKGGSRLDWQHARSAVRAAWHKVERAMPGDFDGDGR